jgi:hypothetical protein
VVAVPVRLPVTTPAFIVTLDIEDGELTNKLPPMPTPPDTTKAPEVVFVDDVVLEMSVVPDIPALPTTCNLNTAFERPIPTLPPYSPIATFKSAFVLKIGSPEISLMENIQPVDKLLLMENNCPELPSKESELSGNTLNVIGEFVAPINAIEGITVVPADPKVACEKYNLP